MLPLFELGLPDREVEALSFVVMQLFNHDQFVSRCCVVPLCDASGGQFSGNILSSTFTWSLKYCGLRCAYLSVIRMFRCPNSFCTTAKSTPFMTSQLAKQ